jgi:hypothetical protein
MSGNFGIGIGSFMAGIERGKEAARAQTAADAAIAQQQFNNNITTNQDQRAGAASTLALDQGNNNLAQNKTLFGQQQKDYADNAELRKLQREDKETDITDVNETSAINTAAAADSDAAYNAAKGKSIFVGKDPTTGQPTYSVDGQAVPSQQAASELYDQTHADRMDTYWNVGGPKIVSDMLASGDTAGAAAFQKAHQDHTFQKGVDSLGRLEGAAQVGNWDGVNTHLNAILSNGGYINPANHEASATPIIDPASGKATGLTVNYKNKNTGEQVTKNFNSMSDLHSALHSMINPQAAVAYNQSIQDAQAAAAAETAKGKDKLGNEIALANVNSDNTIRENTAKAALPESIKDREAGIAKWYSNIENGSGFPTSKGPDGKDVEMTEPQKQRMAADQYDASRVTAGAAPSTSPFGNGAPPILSSRPDASQPAPSTNGSPVPTITQRSRAFWGDKGITMPWWGAQPAAPVARGILPAQAPTAPASPGSVTSYEASHNLANIPDVPPAAPEILRHPMQGQAPAGGEGVDAYEQRLGLAATPPPAPPVVIDNTPQGRGIEAYIASLRPSAAQLIEAKRKAAQRAFQPGR